MRSTRWWLSDAPASCASATAVRSYSRSFASATLLTSCAVSRQRGVLGVVIELRGIDLGRRIRPLPFDGAAHAFLAADPLAISELGSNPAGIRHPVLRPVHWHPQVGR